MKAENKNQARHLFFQGMTLRKAAIVVGVSKSSTERWSSEEGWAEQRQLLEFEVRDKFIKENLNWYYANVLNVVDTAYRIMMDGLAERQLVSQGKLAQHRLKVTNQILMAVAKTYLSLDKIVSDLDSYKRAARLG